MTVEVRLNQGDWCEDNLFILEQINLRKYR